MAVEAHQINLFPSQLLTDNRKIIKPNLLKGVDLYNNGRIDSTMPMPLPLPAATMPESLLPFYQSTVCDPASAKTSTMNKCDSGLTYHLPAGPRKRCRDFTAELNALPIAQKNKLSSESSFLDQDILYQFHNHQSEIDRFIAQHSEKVRIELEQQRMRQSRMLLSAIQEAMVKKLKEKDEEIQRIGRQNLVLQERVKSLCVENQIWRQLAQANEATANSLRTNLEQVLAHVSDDHLTAAGAALADAVADDAESSCGSNDEAGCTLAAVAREETTATQGVRGGDAVGCGGSRRMCKKCGVRESIVLLLPCRHLCLCTVCGSTVHDCPVCHSGMDASVHVNFS